MFVGTAGTSRTGRKPREGKAGASDAWHFFAAGHAKAAIELKAKLKAIRQNKKAVLRVEASERRIETGDQVLQSRERMRHINEPGGLVQKAGLIELAMTTDGFCSAHFWP